ncbi:MAG: protein O-mannosyl-transferase family [Anaerolineae bacterium]
MKSVCSTNSRSHPPHSSAIQILTNRVTVCTAAAGIALVAYLCTLQWGINSGGSPYTTDVGEIQNALPRWGTLHYTGYPLYSLLGSLVVSLLRLAGIAPAGGSSLVSALWGAAAVGLLAALAFELGLPRWTALGSALLGGLTLSFWVNSSLAEVHTMTMALSLAVLLYALRLRRSGARSDLLWLALWLTQAVAHQRAALLLVLPAAILAARHWRLVLRSWLPLLGIAFLAAATYLYLPIRAWMGADWTFGQVGTWHGFWDMILDTKVERGVAMPATLAEWLQRAKMVLDLLAQDMPLVLLALGLAGLWSGLRRRGWAVGAALAASMLVYYAVSLVVWEGKVSDALLAVKLPVALIAALGLGMLTAELTRRWKQAYFAGAAVLAGILIFLGWTNAPQVLALTRDNAIEATIAQVERTRVPSGVPATLLLPWGQDYWAMRYAQSYRGQFKNLTIVDHNADLKRYAADGIIFTLAKTFYVLPIGWWQDRLGEVRLDAFGAGMVRISSALSPSRPAPRASAPFDLGNGIVVLSVRVKDVSDSQHQLIILWQNVSKVDTDYAVGVQLIGTAANGTPNTVISQADSANPVYGLYPTSRWQVNEVVRDVYSLSVPEGAEADRIDLFMYTQDQDGQFSNTEMLEIGW